MKRQDTLGIVTVAAPQDPLSICLDSVNGLADELVVFTWSDEHAETALRYGARSILIEELPYIEPFRQTMQTALSTDWILVLDPDEALEPGAVSHFREKMRGAARDIAGFWVPQRMLFFGRELSHSFPGVKQLRLFRRNRVAYSSTIHSSPEPVEGRFEHFDDSEPGIRHYFVRSLEPRIQRHLLWAKIEAQQAFERGTTVRDLLDPVRAALDELAFYIVERGALKDGMPGLANALLQSWKSAVTALFLWEMHGAGELPCFSEPDFIGALQKLRAEQVAHATSPSLHTDL
jgi:hypothetical protein